MSEDEAIVFLQWYLEEIEGMDTDTALKKAVDSVKLLFADTETKGH